jgi:hypothetical protein
MLSVLEHPSFTQHLQQLSPRSDRLWLLGLSIGLSFTLLAAYRYPFATSGQFWAYAGLLARAWLYTWAGEARAAEGGVVLSRLFQLGIVAGLFELLVDWWLVHGLVHGRLIYLPANDVVLLASPLWMPLAWACVIVELGYPGVRLFAYFRRHRSAGQANIYTSLVLAPLAGVTVGFYEYFAYRAGWWKYAPANYMVGDFCALYIPLGEAFMFSVIVLVAARTLSRSDRTFAAVLEGGALFAGVIGGSYALAYLLLELRDGT